MTLEEERAAAVAAANARAAERAAAVAAANARAAAAKEGPVVEPGAAAAPVSNVESYLRGAGEGVTMGWGDEGGALMDIDVLKGDWGKQYEDKLKDIREKQERAQKANPEWYLGGQFTGGTATAFVPGLGPARTAGLLGNTFRLGAVGGVMGGIYGAGAADGDINSRVEGAKTGALWGTPIGAAGPSVARGLGAGYRAISGLRQGAEGSAANVMARVAGADNLADAMAIQRELERLGPQSMPADLGPNLLTETGRIARVPNTQAQTVVRDALIERQRGANTRIQGDVDATLGPAPEPYRVTGEFSDGTPVPPAGRDAAGYSIREAQDALSARYDEVLNNPQQRAVDTRELANDLDAMIANRVGDPQAALRRVRQMLNIEGTDQLDPLPAKLHEVRKTIDGLRNASTDTTVQRVLGDARRRIDQELATKVPGLKELDVQYAELARQREAFDLGRTVLQSGREAPPPGELQTRIDLSADPAQSRSAAAAQQGPVEPGVNRASLGQVQGPSASPFRLSQGTRAEIDRIIGTNSNNVVDLNRMIKGDGSWNRQRLASLFGEDRADTIINIVERERTFADTFTGAIRNSETARRELADAKVPFSIQEAVARAVRYAASRALGGVTDASRQRRDLALARMLTDRTPAPAPGELSPAIQSVADAIARRNRSLAWEHGADLAITGGGRGLTTSR